MTSEPISALPAGTPADAYLLPQAIATVSTQRITELQLANYVNTKLGIGYLEISNGLSTTLTNPMPNFINVSNAGAGININLPDMTQSNALQSSLLDIFYIINNDASQIVNVLDHSTSSIATIYPGQIYSFAVKSNATPAGVFIPVNLTKLVSVTSPLSLSSHGILSMGLLTGNGYLAVTSGTNYTLTNPCATYVEVNMTAPSLTFVLPIMNASNSLQANAGAQIVINNVGTHPFVIADQGFSYFYELNPGQNVTLKVTSNSSASGAFTAVASSGSSSAAGYPGAPQSFSLSGATFLPSPVPVFSSISTTTGGVSVSLPSILAGSGNQLNIGQSIYIYNSGSNSFTLLDVAAGTIISSVLPGQIYQLFVLTNSTMAGTYTVRQLNNNAGLTGGGYSSITSATSVVLTNPCPTIIDANFTASGQALDLPDMTQSNALQASQGATIRITNTGSNTFILRKHGPAIIYSQVLPGQTILLSVTDNSTAGGTFDIENLHIQPSFGSSIPYAVLGGSYTYTNASGFYFDDFTHTLNSPNINTPGNITATGDITGLNLSGINHGDLTTDVVSTGTPNSTGMFMTSGSPSTPQVLQLCAADGSNPGAMTAGTQTIGGDKTFANQIRMSTTTGTFQRPKLTTTQKNALTASEGDMVFDLTLHAPYYYNGTAWVVG